MPLMGCRNRAYPALTLVVSHTVQFVPEIGAVTPMSSMPAGHSGVAMAVTVPEMVSSSGDNIFFFA